MSKVSVESLGIGNKEGFLTKCGGSIKTWKKRWFVLKGDVLFYFKTQKDADLTGSIQLEPTSVCKEEPSKNRKDRYYMSVSTARRTYEMYSDNQAEIASWVKEVNERIKIKSGGSATKAAATPASATAGATSTPSSASTADSSSASSNSAAAAASASPSSDDSSSSGSAAAGGAGAQTNTDAAATAKSSPSKSVQATSNPREQIKNAKSTIPFLQDEQSKVLEFWQIWSESIPAFDELTAGTSVEFHVSTSADMKKLTWRTAGPQNVFIQKMVDFFWNVGAPESEIDRLNDVGALINPVKIGSWIDMSQKGGMDGGWYFPVEIPIKTAIEASDAGDPSRKVREWAEKHSIASVVSVGRDMGAAPPRQTEVRFKLPGDSFEKQLEVAKDAYSSFSFPEIPEPAMKVLEKSNSAGLLLSVVTSSDGFVRIGLLCPTPSWEEQETLATWVGASADTIKSFQSALSCSGPAYVEYQYLMEGFGYGVYKEGFDIQFLYHVGDECK